MKIKSATNEISGLTHWWVEDEYGGQLIRSGGFVDPQECQRNLDLTRQAFMQDAVERGEGQ